MKRLLACLLLAGIAGCGGDAQKALEENTAAQNANTEAINAQNETNESSGDNEKPFLEGERPAGKKALPKNDLSAALSGKRLHVKIDGLNFSADFYSDGTCYFNRGDERSPQGQWNTTGNRLKLSIPISQGGPVDRYLVFTDLTAPADSEVIGLRSADQAESEGTKGMIVRVEPAPPALKPSDATPPEDE